jgi:two-component system, LuxR family, response regulator FixJ
MKLKKQIYIVDDDESVCRALKIFLATYGFLIDTFASAEEFFRAVSNNTPSCLVLDIHMPGLSGWETLNRIMASKPIRPVILVSADKNGGLNEKALSVGAMGFLQKPFDNLRLIDLINLAFKKKGGERHEK